MFIRGSALPSVGLAKLVALVMNVKLLTPAPRSSYNETVGTVGLSLPWSANETSPRMIRRRNLKRILRRHDLCKYWTQPT